MNFLEEYYTQIIKQLQLVLFKIFFKVKIYIFRFIVPYIIELTHKYENMLNENQ